MGARAKTRELSDLIVVIPAAGKGTRMGELTRDTPKPMVEVLAKPILHRIIEDLVQSLGVKKFVVVVGHGKQKIIDYFGDGAKFGASIEYVEQTQQLGLAHAILQTEQKVASAGAGDFLVHLGDNFFMKPNFREVVETHFAKRADATFLVESVSVEQAKKLGVLVVGADGRVVDIQEKPAKPKSVLAATGFYAFNKKFFDAAKRVKPSARGEYEVADVTRLIADEGGRVYAVQLKGHRVKLDDCALATHWKDVACLEDVGYVERVIKNYSEEQKDSNEEKGGWTC